MFSNVQEFFGASKEAVAAFAAWSNAHLPKARADHLCYKCGTSGEFEHLRALLEKESVFVYQSIISKRRIAIIKFLEPIKTPLGDISVLELSDQKPDTSQVSGFDHIEIYPVSQTLDELVSDLEQKGTAFEKVVRPHHTTFDTRIMGEFKVRLEVDELIEKIKKAEMV